MNPKEQLRAALEALCAREGGIEAVADAANVSAGYLRQIINRTPLQESKRPRNVGPQLADKLEAAFPGWANPKLDRSAAREEYQKIVARHTKGGSVTTPVAHPVRSDPSQNVRIAWEDMMSEGVPELFTVALQDDALEPELYEGDDLVIDTSEAAKRQARPGCVAILVSEDGRPIARFLRERRPGEMTGHAVNAAYDPVDLKRDGFTIFGICIEARRKNPRLRLTS